MKRTEHFNIIFKDGIVDGWVLGVPEAFRDQLDIKYSKLVDNEESYNLRRKQPRNEDTPLPTIYRMAWTQGVPPLYSFNVGHVFYDPPCARNMAWDDALRGLRRSVQVTEARIDELPKSGWVKLKIWNFHDGKCISSQNYNMPQVEFVAFLRTGQLSNPEQLDLGLTVSVT